MEHCPARQLREQLVDQLYRHRRIMPHRPSRDLLVLMESDRTVGASVRWRDHVRGMAKGGGYDPSRVARADMGSVTFLDPSLNVVNGLRETSRSRT